MIHLNLNSTTLEVGQYLKGECLWNPLDKEAKKKAKLIVGWRTEGRGDIDREIIYEVQIEPDIRSSFDCQIPLLGPVSYDGQLLRVIWKVSVTLSEWMGLKKQQKSQVFRVIPRTMHR